MVGRTEQAWSRRARAICNEQCWRNGTFRGVGRDIDAGEETASLWTRVRPSAKTGGVSKELLDNSSAWDVRRPRRCGVDLSSVLVSRANLVRSGLVSPGSCQRAAHWDSDSTPNRQSPAPLAPRSVAPSSFGVHCSACNYSNQQHFVCLSANTQHRRPPRRLASSRTLHNTTIPSRAAH
jgi:hypothetical protein